MGFQKKLTGVSVQLSRQQPCETCPFRSLKVFRDFTDKELEFVSGFKNGELIAEAGATLLLEGAMSPHIFTVLSGWGFRYKVLPDGRRQVLNFVMPGDIVGLQGSMLGEMQHSVEALSGMLLCVFERSCLWELFSKHPGLAFDVTWLSAREEQILDEHLLSVGRRTALERLAYLLLHIYTRADALGLVKANRMAFPFTQQLLADTLGLSLVHTNKTLRRLCERKLVRWKGRQFELLDQDALAEVAAYEPTETRLRPFI